MICKYGGVWADATTLMTQPLDKILGSDMQVRTFYALPYPWTDQSLKDNDAWHCLQSMRQVFWGVEHTSAEDTRVTWLDHPQNWFLAAPPGDLFMLRLKECVWQFLAGVARQGSAAVAAVPLRLPSLIGVGLCEVPSGRPAPLCAPRLFFR